MASVGVGTTGYSLNSNKSLTGETVNSTNHGPCKSNAGGTQTGGSFPKASRGGEVSKIDEVSKDKIWRQSVHNEARDLKSWKENWGFLAEFDERGRPKSPKKLPDKVALFSEAVPSTTGATYGGRLNTAEGLTMQNLEFRYYSDKRRRKMGNEMVCY